MQRNVRRNRRGRNASKKPREHQEMRSIEKKLGLILPPEQIRVARNMPYLALKNPKGPRPGAQYTTRQMASTFGIETGLSNIGGSSSPAQLIQNGSSAVYFALGFQLSDLPQSATFAALFDQYKLEKVKIHFKSRNNAVSVFNTASPNGGVPTGYVVVDRDDATALSSTSDALQYDNVQSFSGEEDFTVELVPSMTPPVFASGAFSGYTTVPSDSLWIDIANTSVPAYGIKGHIGPLAVSTTSAWTWDITAEYIVSMRKTR